MIGLVQSPNGEPYTTNTMVFNKSGSHSWLPVLLYQLCMVLNCLLNSLGFNADVPLGGGCAAVLQKPLHKGNVEPVIVVDFRCVPLAEAVGTDALVVQIVAHDFQLLLDCPLRDRENQLIVADTVAQTVVLNVLLNDKGNCEKSALACLLLHHFKSVPVCVPYDIASVLFY